MPNRHSSVHSSENEEPEVEGVSMLYKGGGRMDEDLSVKAGRGRTNTSIELINEGLNMLNKSSSKTQLAAGNPILKPLNNPGYSRPKRAGQGGIILNDLPKEQQIFIPEENSKLV